MRNRNLLVLAVVVAVGAALLAWAAWWKTPGRHSGPTVGVVLASSGTADFIGKPEREVLERLARQFDEELPGGMPFELQIRDSAGRPEQALTLFRQFAGDSNVIAVIGPSTSGETLALVDEAHAVEIPLLSLAASKEIVTDGQGRTREWVFKFAQNDDLAATRLAIVMKEAGTSSIALLYSNDGFGKSGAGAFRSVLAASYPDLRIVHEASFDRGMTQAEPHIAALPANAQAVLIWGTAPGPALLTKALHLSGNKARLFLSHGNASVEFIRSTGVASEGAVVVGSRVLMDQQYLRNSDERDEVIRRFKTMSDSHFAGHARDALVALLEASKGADDLGRMGTRDARKQIRDGLERITGMHGITGTFRFSPNDHAGLALEAFELYVIREQKFLPLSAQ